jgi:hypothetical protein
MNRQPSCSGTKVVINNGAQSSSQIYKRVRFLNVRSNQFLVLPTNAYQRVPEPLRNLRLFSNGTNARRAPLSCRPPGLGKHSYCLVISLNTQIAKDHQWACWVLDDALRSEPGSLPGDRPTCDRTTLVASSIIRAELFGFLQKRRVQNGRGR